METKYDVFISYRREGGEQKARIIQQALIARGYNVFLDFDELRDGKFNEALKKAIVETPIFLILLTRGCLDRCVNEGDWVRVEIETAIESNCRILPVNPDGEFDGKFPEELPIELKKAIGQHQFSDVMFKTLFKESVDKMVRDRIQPVIKPDNSGVAPSISSREMVAIHLETDIACAVLRFKSLECVVSVGEDKVLHLLKGRHKFTFQSLDNEQDRYDYVYEVQDDVKEDFIDINLLRYKKERLREEAIDRKRRNPQGNWFLGEFYEYGIEEDYDKDRVKLLEEKKDSGSVEDVFELGVHYQLGWGTEQNASLAFECFMRGAEKGYAKAEAAVGLAYLIGDGVDENYEKGLEYMYKAESQSLPYAYYYLGLCYSLPLGEGEMDDKKAFTYFCRADSQGVLSATYELAECYLMGKGVPINEKKALELYESILIQDTRRGALIRKGECYLYGWGVDKDYSIAFQCFQTASIEDTDGELIERALFDLGKCYEHSHGVEKNYLKAIELYIKSEYYGGLDAKERLENELTPSRVPKLIADVNIIIGQIKEVSEKHDSSNADDGVSREKDLMILYKFLSDYTEDNNAPFELAKCYEEGLGCEMDISKANELWQKLIDKGDNRAYFELGVNIILDGDNCDKTLGMDYLQHAIDNGDDKAMLFLGRVFNDEELGFYSLEEAMRNMQMAADEGNPEAQWRLASLFEQKNELERAYTWFTKSAIQQDIIGRYHYARCLFYGIGCQQEINAGLKVFEQIANEGSSEAQCFLGNIYEEGINVGKDMRQAAKWYELAADQGSVEGMFRFAFIYLNGEGGVKENNKKALQCFRQAAGAGHSRAEYFLGLIYENGECGVDVDLEEACIHYKKASDQGDRDAILHYGLFLGNGLGGCAVDKIAAFQYYLKAAEMGCTEAQTEVGNCYLKGEGVRKSLKKAEKYLRLAAGEGDCRGIGLLGDLFRMTKRYQKAVGCYEKLFQDGDSLAALLLGNMYGFCKEMGTDSEKSIYYYNQAIEMSTPDNECFIAGCWNEMAYVKFHSGNLEAALEAVEHALEHGPKADYYDSKGEFLMRLGRQEEAMEMYNKVLELNPNFFREVNSDLYKLLFPETK